MGERLICHLLGRRSSIESEPMPLALTIFGVSTAGSQPVFCYGFPGRVNPDAETVDVPATENHIQKLIGVANEWSEQLCGNISIIHIKRG